MRNTVKTNHGLPTTITSEGVTLTLLKDTYETLAQQGYTREDVDSWYGANGDIATIYSYYSDEVHSLRVGVEFTNGRLCIYGCRSDVEDCTEAEFVTELTDTYYLG